MTNCTENLRWVLERLAANFMRQGFSHDEAWRRARLLAELERDPTRGVQIPPLQ
jgi:hypothetical protein